MPSISDGICLVSDANGRAKLVECLNIVADIVMAKRHKPVLVFVNPAGGAGKAYRLVMEHAVGVWSEAEFQYHIIITGV